MDGIKLITLGTDYIGRCKSNYKYDSNLWKWKETHLNLVKNQNLRKRIDLQVTVILLFNYVNVYKTELFFFFSTNKNEVLKIK